MGFNVKQPGRVKTADLALLIIAVVVIAGLVFWATR